jgi:hypothetical protein
MSTPDGYTSGWFLHSYKKHDENLLLMLPLKGERYIDPRKLSYWHTQNFVVRLCSVKTEDYMRVKTRAAIRLGLGSADDNFAQRVADLEDEVKKYRDKADLLQIERNLYKDLCEKTMVSRSDSKEEPAEESDDTLTKSERNKFTQAQNREKYLPKQAYIDVRRNKLKMTYVTVGLICGYSAHAIGNWAKGNAPADWEALEKAFPGIEKEADKWASEQKKEG